VSGFRVSTFRAGAASSTLQAASLIALAIAVLAVVLLLLSSPTFADSGADVYKMRCSACHGPNGAGQTMIGRNLKLRSLAAPEVQNETDAQLEAIITQGRNRMPSYSRKLSKDQIAAVVKYIRSLKE
jgi:mono/diheme cytochrome c family protein